MAGVRDARRVDDRVGDEWRAGRDVFSGDRMGAVSGVAVVIVTDQLATARAVMIVYVVLQYCCRRKIDWKSRVRGEKLGWLSKTVFTF